MALRLLLAVLLFGTALPVQAALVTWGLRGVVREVQITALGGSDPALLSQSLGSLGAVVGAEFSASIRFETSAIDVFPQPDTDYYPDAIDILDVTIGAWSLELASAHSAIEIRRIGGLPGERFHGSLVDSTGTLATPAFRADLIAFSGELPLTAVPPELSRLVPFQPGGGSGVGYGTALTLSGCGPLACAVFWADIGAVPEPVAAALAGFGLLALAALRSRRSS